MVLDELSTRIDQARSSNGILVAVQQAQQKTKQHPKGASRGGGAKKSAAKPTRRRSKAKASQCKINEKNLRKGFELNYFS